MRLFERTRGVSSNVRSFDIEGYCDALTGRSVFVAFM